MTPGVSKRLRLRAAAQLACVAACAVVLPAIFCRAIKPAPGEILPESDFFEPHAERDRLVKVRPDWILIGNSMLNSRLDWRTLSEISGRKARKVSQGGTQSAIWFLFLKNVVVRSGGKPEWVTIFFRDTDLSWPEFRTEGVNEDLIRRLRDPMEPEYDSLLATDRKGGPVGLTKSLIETAFPSDELTSAGRRKLQNLAFDLTDAGADIRRGNRRVELNELFSLGRLRHDLGSDLAGASSGAPVAGVAANDLPDPGMYDGAPMKFDPSPSVSFLPHMVALAHKHGFKLHFHRIKRRPLADNSRPDSRLLQAYMAELRSWLEAQGCVLTDESQDPSLTLAMYVDGDHISVDSQRAYAENFWARVQPIIGAGNRTQRR
ncbi:MAG: hypothetical protein ACR2OZ_04035 [Verrucomicrobiales bacterium]